MQRFKRDGSVLNARLVLVAGKCRGIRSMLSRTVVRPNERTFGHNKIGAFGRVGPSCGLTAQTKQYNLATKENNYITNVT